MDTRLTNQYPTNGTNFKKVIDEYIVSKYERTYVVEIQNLVTELGVMCEAREIISLNNDSMYLYTKSRMIWPKLRTYDAKKYECNFIQKNRDIS